MSAAPEIINAQNISDISQPWKALNPIIKESGKSPIAIKLSTVDVSSSADEYSTKIRKPYTITKQRERWTEDEHQKFLDALKLYGRAWRRIEEYIGTKTAVQIRSHAQKFFCKLEREASTSNSDGRLLDIVIPPPRPKRKPSHPYPKKTGNSPCMMENQSKEITPSSCLQGIAATHPNHFRNAEPSNHNGSCHGPHGRVKIFGESIVSSTERPHLLKPIGKDCSVSSRQNVILHKPGTVDERNQAACPSPYVKDTNSSDNLLAAPLFSNENGPSSMAAQSEGTDESFGGSPVSELANGNSVAVGSSATTSGECKSTGSTESISPPDSKPCGRVDMQCFQGSNPGMQSWIEHFIHHQSRMFFPPVPANGIVDGASSSLSYWQAIQASAINYAAYTATMAAAVAVGWKTPNPGGLDSSGNAKCLTTEAATPSVASALGTYGGFVPPIYFPLPSGLYPQSKGTYMAHDNNSTTEVFEEVPAQQGHADANLDSMQEEKIIESNVKTSEDTDMEKNIDSNIQAEHKLDASCLTEAYEYMKGSSECKCPCNLHITRTEKCPTEGSDSETHASAKNPEKRQTEGSDSETEPSRRKSRNMDSSCDEYDDERKKKGEGSSSGSNILESRCHFSEFDTQMMLDTVKKDRYNLSEGNSESCSEVRNSHWQSNTSKSDLSKLSSEVAEKHTKHLRKITGHSGNENVKRFKSSIHDLEPRKEVSEEGRKAFEALFSSKLLPQSFPTSNVAEIRCISLKDNDTSPAACGNEVKLD
ncbi:hypothetical protein KP509_07G057200 [Ceratopteris richardii]|uniref:LHY n=1 Tax=Ceratopteris richardii TaxID=49495 RepID=A0A8T2ULJ5_CERRI|nr:hypothetical protein KP509_07G057200 [Ceratopteris richardii]